MREWTIIGSVSYWNRYWVYRIDRIVSASIVSADIMCITAYSAAVNTGCITQEIKGHSRPVTCRARGLEVREEGDCNLILASPWHNCAVLGLGHQRQMTPTPSTSRNW